MLENILIVDATMIVGVLFVEAMGRAMGIGIPRGMGRWMFIWGLVALLPFSTSSVLALSGNELAVGSAGVGFVGFTVWFLFISYTFASGRREVQKIVEENDLPQFLQQGYCVVAVLNSGKVVIEL